MKFHPLTAVVLLGLPASFAAGWWLKPVEAGSGSGQGPSIRTVAGPPGSGLGTSATSATALRMESPRVEIKPLTSLQEIIDALGADLNTRDDKLVMIAMMELVPRLMLTDIGTVQEMLGDLEKSDVLGGDMATVVSMGLIMRWMVEQPESALGYSLDHPTMFEAGDELNGLGLMFLAKTRPQAAQAMANRMPESDRNDWQEILFMMQAVADPGKILRNPDPTQPLRDRQKLELAARWMQADPASAKAWLDGLPADQREPELVAGMAAVRMKQDPVSTLAWISSLPEGPEKAASRNQILSQALTGVKDQAAFELKLGQYPSEWHDAIRLKWLNQNRNNEGADPGAELKTLMDRNPALGEDGSAMELARRLADEQGRQGKFTEGADWVQSLPPGQAQVRAMSSLVSHWTAKDPEAASGWVKQLPAGPARDGAAQALIKQIQQDDPVSALAWAQSLSTESARKATATGVFQAWFGKKPLEAAAAIQNLSPEIQQRIFVK